MVAKTILCAAIIWPGPVDTITMTGYLSQYGRDPTVATIAYRQAVGDLPLDMNRYAGVIAVADCGLIGHEARLRVEDAPWQDVIIFDCSGDVATSEWMQDSRVIAELGYGLAKQHGIIGKGGIHGQLVIEG